MKHCSKFIPIRTACFRRLRPSRPTVHLRDSRGSTGGRHGLSDVTQTTLQLLNPLTQRPFQALRIRYTRLKKHTPLIRLTQETLELCHMRAESLDDCVCRLLKLFFQFLNGGREIFILLVAVLTSLDDVAHDEQQNSTENDEGTQNFGHGNNGRTPPYPRYKLISR